MSDEVNGAADGLVLSDGRRISIWVGEGSTGEDMYTCFSETRIGQLCAEIERRGATEGLEHELALMRSLLSEYIRGYEKYREELTTWYASLKDPKGAKETRPKGILEVTVAGKMIGEIGRIHDRIMRQRATTTMSLSALNPVLERMGSEVVLAAEETIKDAQCRSEFLDAVTERWATHRGVGGDFTAAGA